MIIDHILNHSRYLSMHPYFKVAFDFILKSHSDLPEPGKYAIDSDNVFAIVSTYETIAEDGEKMEAHRKYIDIQYWISGIEKVGHDILRTQSLAKEYDDEKDFLLSEGAPQFFSVMKAGMFAIYYPSDLHMPCIQYDAPDKIKKIVIKVKVNP